jgi:transposase
MAGKGKIPRTIEGVDIQQTIASIRQQLDADDSVSPALRASTDLLILVVTLLANRLGLNSQNSHTPPSADPNREKTPRKTRARKPGGQPGHAGNQLQAVADPDEIEILSIDRRTLPQGHYLEAGYEARQVVDIEFVRFVTEYRAQVLVNELGQRFVAAFPDSVTRPVQYGRGLKAHAVYLSQFQLLPYQRIADYFQDQLGIPVSTGSIVNFNLEAAGLLQDLNLADHIRAQLHQQTVLHADETGINVNGVRHWLHCASSASWTYFTVHRQRGTEAMEDAGILPGFAGILCHDHWKPYYTYDQCLHALCNAHHLRELERAHVQDGMNWAAELKNLLLEINDKVDEVGGVLSTSQAGYYRGRYRKILQQGETESPPPDELLRKPGQRGRLKRSKSRSLLERLRDYEQDVLRFMVEPQVPFTNNQGENDIRMTKVQQKISGCFRSMEGAQTFCLIRSYLSTCRKQGVSASEALRIIHERRLPDFFGKGGE